MKDFEGTVVIVDPEKFIKKEDLGQLFDLKIARISPKAGFKTIFFTTTGVGSFFLAFHKVDNIKEYYQMGNENWVRGAIDRAFLGDIRLPYGYISSDSGVVGVFLLEDIEKYNPGALKDLKPGEDYMILDNYRGKIGYLRDKYGVVHFYGTGTSNFYTL